MAGEETKDPTRQEKHDDRSQQMNREHERGRLADDNRSRQLNPDDKTYRKSRGGLSVGG